MIRRATGRTSVVLVATVAPWTWFVVRHVHRLAEWCAILLPLLGAVAVVVGAGAAAVLRTPALLLPTASVLAVTVTATAAPWAPQPTGAPAASVRLLTANVLGDNDQAEAVAQDLLTQRADVLVASEVTPLLEPMSRRLDRAYSHRYRAGGEDGVAVWSVFPLDGRDLPASGDPAAAQGGPGRRRRSLRVLRPVRRPPLPPLAEPLPHRGHDRGPGAADHRLGRGGPCRPAPGGARGRPQRHRPGTRLPAARRRTPRRSAEHVDGAPPRSSRATVLCCCASTTCCSQGTGAPRERVGAR